MINKEHLNAVRKSSTLFFFSSFYFCEFCFVCKKEEKKRVRAHDGCPELRGKMKKKSTSPQRQRKAQEEPHQLLKGRKKEIFCD